MTLDRLPDLDPELDADSEPAIDTDSEPALDADAEHDHEADPNAGSDSDADSDADSARDSEHGLHPAPGETRSEEVALTEDVLVKVFALGPGASVPPHEHPDSTNVFHVLRGAPTVIRDDDEATVEAPGVVINERGAVHGLRNDGERVAVVTASFSPPPG